MIGASLRELWLLYCGKMESLRYQVLWQSSVLFHEKLDAEEFLRTGDLLNARPARVTMSEELKEKVQMEIGCMNGVKHDGEI